jgi:signal transduction histidine kinase
VRSLWLVVLALAAGLSMQDLLPVHSGWVPVLMVALAYPAGRRLASLSSAVWVFTATAFAGLALAFWRSSNPLSDWLAMAMTGFLAAVLPWWAGRYRRLSAEQREREHAVVAQQARLRERARIAQDMHDVLGHELALIALHGGALELAAGLTDEQRRTVGDLRARAVRATERLHDVVRVLGSSDAAAGLQPPDESIDGLVRRAAAAGLRVRLRRDEPAPAWPSMTGQAAHRVVQEALTNAARHAPGAAVTVTVTRRGIDVVNEPATAPGGGPGTGQGLIGLDERVRLSGGRLDAGPRPDGGWVVSAVLPDGAPGNGVLEDGPSILDLAGSRRLTRRRLLQTATLPMCGVLALFAGLAVIQVLSAERSGLAHDRYAGMRPGQPREQVVALLPPRDVGRPEHVRAEPPQPAGSSCLYYRAGAGVLVVDPDYYRICFADGVLVAKDRVARA